MLWKTLRSCRRVSCVRSSCTAHAGGCGLHVHYICALVRQRELRAFTAPDPASPNGMQRTGPGRVPIAAAVVLVQALTWVDHGVGSPAQRSGCADRLRSIALPIAWIEGLLVLMTWDCFPSYSNLSQWYCYQRTCVACDSLSAMHTVLTAHTWPRNTGQYDEDSVTARHRKPEHDRTSRVVHYVVPGLEP